MSGAEPTTCTNCGVLELRVLALEQRLKEMEQDFAPVCLFRYIFHLLIFITALAERRSHVVQWSKFKNQITGEIK
jgi:hypothetical protein